MTEADHLPVPTSIPPAEVLAPIVATRQRVLVDHWLAWLDEQVAVGQHATGTVAAYANSARYWVRHLEHVARTDEPGPPTVSGFLAAYLVEHRPSSTNAVLGAVRALYRWCEVTGLYPNIARSARAIRDPRDAPLATLDEAHLHARTLHVRDGKGHQQRLLPLMPPALAAVKDYRAVLRMLLKGPDHGALLLDQYGGRWTTGSVRDWFGDLNRARGPGARHLHPHAFRHAFATHLLQGGADIRVVQAALNHARIDTTMRYLRLVPGRLKEAYDGAMPDIAVGLDQRA